MKTQRKKTKLIFAKKLLKNTTDQTIYINANLTPIQSDIFSAARWWWRWLMFYGHCCAHGRLNWVMKWSQRWNTLQVYPCRDSNSGGSDLWSKLPPTRLDYGGAPSCCKKYCPEKRVSYSHMDKEWSRSYTNEWNSKTMINPFRKFERNKLRNKWEKLNNISLKTVIILILTLGLLNFPSNIATIVLKFRLLIKLY